MNDLDRWTHDIAAALDLDPATLDRDLILDLTKDVAHSVARPAAPLTAYLVGLAAGRSGGTREAVNAAVTKTRRLAAEWSADALSGGAERPRGQSPGTASE